MDSSVSPKDEIWFLRVRRHISNAVYNRSHSVADSRTSAVWGIVAALLVAGLTTIMIGIILIAITKITAIVSIATTKATEHYKFWNDRKCIHTGRRIQNAMAQKKPRVERGRGGGLLRWNCSFRALLFLLMWSGSGAFPTRVPVSRSGVLISP